MQFKYVDNLKQGDTILVSNGNYLDLGFFVGYGRNTVQYYTPNSIAYREELIKKEGKQLRPYKSYVQMTSKFRIAKINDPIFSDQEDGIEYEKAKQILIGEGIIKN